jgi:serine/threonine protein kinase
VSSRKIGRYVVHDRLGQGGTGVVTRAWDEELDRWVAIKSVRPDRSLGRRRPALHDEALLTAMVNHPAIVRVHEVVSDHICDHIVMELVTGRPLSDVVSDGPMLATDAAAVAAQIARGLEAAHRLGLIHGDLKAQNVMITGDGTVKILDFGSTVPGQPAGDAEIEERHDMVDGTACAMSPEQAEGRRVGPRSDLFSLGTVIYQMVTGRHPFFEDDPFQTMHNVTVHHPPLAHHVNPAIPESFSKLISELQKKNPNERPRSAGEVADRLESLESTVR